MNNKVRVGQIRSWTHSVYLPFKVIEDGQIPGTYDILYLDPHDDPREVFGVSEWHIFENSKVTFDADEELNKL